MKENIVLVTGANKGIGFGIAKHLGLSGWKVIIGARDEQRTTKAINELKSAGVDVLGWVNIELRELAHEENTERLVKEISRAWRGCRSQSGATAWRPKAMETEKYPSAMGIPAFRPRMNSGLFKRHRPPPTRTCGVQNVTGRL